MRPVTPFITIADLVDFFCAHLPLTCRMFLCMRVCAGRQRRRCDARSRQRSFQFLSPVRHVPRRSITVDHRQRRVAYVRQLMKYSRRDITACPSTRAFAPRPGTSRPCPPHEVNLFLFLVMPRHLPAVRSSVTWPIEKFVAWIGLTPPTRFCVRRRAGYVARQYCLRSAIVMVRFAPKSQIWLVFDSDG